MFCYSSPSGGKQGDSLMSIICTESEEKSGMPFG